jgi:hypothetical protein
MFRNGKLDSPVFLNLPNLVINSSYLLIRSALSNSHRVAPAALLQAARSAAIEPCQRDLAMPP